MSLVGSFLPQIVGTWTIPIATLILGGLVFRDIVRRDAAVPRPKARAAIGRAAGPGTLRLHFGRP